MRRRIVCFAFLLLCVSRALDAQPAPRLALNPKDLKEPDSVYRVAMATGDSLIWAEAYYLYGKRYQQVSEHLKAKEYFMKSLRIQEKRGDSFQHGRLYIRLTEVEIAQWHPADALRYARQARLIFERMRHFKGMSMGAAMIARLYLGGGVIAERVDSAARAFVVQPDSAYKYLRIAERWAKRADDPMLQADVAELLGRVLVARHDKRAIGYLKQSLQMHEQRSEGGTRIRLMIVLASAYLTLGQPQQAKPLLNRINTLWTDQRQIESELRQTRESVLAAYYQAIGDWKQAYMHQNQFHQIQNNGLIADRNGAITRLSVEYETSKREAQLQAQTKELAQRNQFLAVLALLLTATVVIAGVLFRLYRQNKRISRRNAELVQEQNHRVKNNLQVVSSLLNLYAHRLNDPLSKMAVEESQLRVETMALLQRRLYDRQQLATLNLADFIPDIVEGVLKTYGYGSLKVAFSLDSCDLPADQSLPIGLILNELTTNACKYAFPQTQIPSLAVTATVNGRQLSLTVADNGPGFSRGSAHTDSFGLQLIQMQVEQLRGSVTWTTTFGTTFNMVFLIHTS